MHILCLHPCLGETLPRGRENCFLYSRSRLLLQLWDMSRCGVVRVTVETTSSLEHHSEKRKPAGHIPSSTPSSVITRLPQTQPQPEAPLQTTQLEYQTQHVRPLPLSGFSQSSIGCILVHTGTGVAMGVFVCSHGQSVHRATTGSRNTFVQFLEATRSGPLSRN